MCPIPTAIPNEDSTLKKNFQKIMNDKPSEQNKPLQAKSPNIPNGVNGMVHQERQRNLEKYHQERRNNHKKPVSRQDVKPEWAKKVESNTKANQNYEEHLPNQDPETKPRNMITTPASETPQIPLRSESMTGSQNLTNSAQKSPVNNTSPVNTSNGNPILQTQIQNSAYDYSSSSQSSRATSSSGSVNSVVEQPIYAQVDLSKKKQQRLTAQQEAVKNGLSHATSTPLPTYNQTQNYDRDSPVIHGRQPSDGNDFETMQNISRTQGLVSLSEKNQLGPRQSEQARQREMRANDVYRSITPLSFGFIILKFCVCRKNVQF